jgi:hypothetical protein
MSQIYWGAYTPEIETALEGLDFIGKTVRIVSAYEGSGLGSMVSDVKRMCPGVHADARGLAIRGSQARNARKTVENWLLGRE